MANSDDAVISLHEVAKRVGLMGRSRSNWNPLLETLCFKAGIDVRRDDRGVPCCRAAEVPRIKTLVDRHFDRPRYSGRRVLTTVEGLENG